MVLMIIFVNDDAIGVGFLFRMTATWWVGWFTFSFENGLLDWLVGLIYLECSSIGWLLEG